MNLQVRGFKAWRLLEQLNVPVPQDRIPGLRPSPCLHSLFNPFIAPCPTQLDPEAHSRKWQQLDARLAAPTKVVLDLV